MKPTLEHKPVMLKEVLDNLAIKPHGIYVDATFGRGGHARAILSKLADDAQLFAIDKDPEAIQWAQQAFKDNRLLVEQGSFTMLEKLIKQHGLIGKIDGILLDLGVSSPQVDDAERGFSFYKDGPLDMRMDPSQGISAAEWINSAPEKEIAQVLEEYGEERFAKRIAKAIVKERENKPIETTRRLVTIVSEANPKWEKHKHPATRCFQAIRIHINKELDELQTCLQQSLDVLAHGGRLLVISFHSLEDRIVKRFIRKHVKGDEYPPDLPITAEKLQPRLRSLGPPIKASNEEVAENPRARSAILRIAEKLS